MRKLGRRVLDSNPEHVELHGVVCQRRKRRGRFRLGIGFQRMYDRIQVLAIGDEIRRLATLISDRKPVSTLCDQGELIRRLVVHALEADRGSLRQTDLQRIGLAVKARNLSQNHFGGLPYIIASRPVHFRGMFRGVAFYFASCVRRRRRPVARANENTADHERYGETESA